MCHKKNAPDIDQHNTPSSFGREAICNLPMMLPSPGRDRLLPSKPGDEVGQELQQVDPSVIVSSTLAVERTEIIPPRFLAFLEGNLLV